MQPTTPSGNLDRAAQDTQLRMGVLALAAALAVAAVIGRSGAAPVYRALNVVPFFVASYGVLAALYGTCGITAIAGRRLASHGSERIADRHELTEVRVKGLKILSLSFVLAACATALFVWAA